MQPELKSELGAVEEGKSSGTRSYEGSELELFSRATNWKAYWSSFVAPFVRGHVLDVGAGIGSTAELFRNVVCDHWIALEPDPNMSERIGTLALSGGLPKRVEARCGTTQQLDQGECFDTILYVDVLEHIEDDAGELERAACHLAPGGSLVVLAPAHNALYTPFDRAIGHYRRYDRKLLASIKPGNLDLVTMRYFDSVGMLASMGNRLLLRSAQPTSGQIQFWDSVLVPVSQIVDPLLFGRVGKTIIGVFKAPGAKNTSVPVRT